MLAVAVALWLLSVGCWRLLVSVVCTWSAAVGGWLLVVEEVSLLVLGRVLPFSGPFMVGKTTVCWYLKGT
jgi:hypothetical protein